MSYMGVVRLDPTLRDVMDSVNVCPRQGRGSACFVCLLFDACYWVFCGPCGRPITVSHMPLILCRRAKALSDSSSVRYMVEENKRVLMERWYH